MIDGLAQRRSPASSEEAAPGCALSGPPRSAITFFYYDDLPAAVAFYRTIIGLPLVMSDAWCVVFALNGGAQLGLVDAVAGSQRPIEGRNKGAILSFEVDDVADCLDRLKRLSVAAPDDELVVGCGGRTQEFKIYDPGGYTVEFFRWAERPSIAVR
jgi:catechol 2,3-dioxygenase-like lactoylglutathione lyase family enzyme